MDTPLIGLDLVEVERFSRALVRHPGLEQRLFTEAEIAYCRARGTPALHFAARFAAKEAIGKLLGTGVISWREIEVAGALPEGQPSGAGPSRVVLRGRTAEVARERGIAGVQVSLSHVDSLAGACAVVTARSWGGTVMMDERSYSDSSEVEAGEGFPSLETLADKAAVFTAAQMREMDRQTIEDIGVPGLVLMERAAQAVSRLIRTRFPGRHTLIVCGQGNNGGDGIAAARLLRRLGLPFHINWVARRDNAADFPAMVAQAKELGAAGVNILMLKPDAGHRAVEALTGADFFRLADFLRRYDDPAVPVGIESCYPALRLAVYGRWATGVEAGCGAGRNTVAVDVGGSLRPCRHLDHPEAGLTIGEYWHKSATLAMLRVTEDTVGPPCRVCDELSCCRPCRAAADKLYGDLAAGDRRCPIGLRAVARQLFG
jgi:holo-[acyl-carrier protein] synthase